MAMTVTPEIVRVAFRRRSGKSFGFSSRLSSRIISEFDNTFASLCFAETCILVRSISRKLGDGVLMSI